MKKGKIIRKSITTAATLAAAYAYLTKTGEIAPVGSDNFKESLIAYGKKTGLETLDKTLTGGLSFVEKLLCEPSSFGNIPSADDFYVGTEEFLRAPAKGAKWYLGSAWASLVPDDWQTHPYFLGGYMVADNGFTNRVEELIDDMRIRCIALSDNSDRGVHLFGTIDCIGFANKDIRIVRSKVAEKAKEAGIKLGSVNIFSTHCHSCIDTQGLWTKTEDGGKILSNMLKSVKGEEVEKGTDMHFLEVLYERAADALWAAVEDMTPGKMTFAQKDIGSGYVDNRNRPSATALPTVINRFLFTPTSKKKAPTMIVNIGAHPDVAGLATSDGSGNGREISGDYVYYLGETLAEYGYNCMFFNGAIAGIYMARGLSNDGQPMKKRYEQSLRYGRELAKIVIALTKTQEEIEADTALSEPETVAKERELGGKGYTLWYENWEPVKERKLNPVLNVRIREIVVPVKNPLIRIAGKLAMANYDIARMGKNGYCVTTEIGYMEWDDVKIAMVPGELVTDLYKGGASLTAEGSCRGYDFGYPCLCDIFGDDLVCFGLANDAIGYIVPDNDYSMRLLDGHYHETLSLGDETGSTMIKGFLALNREL